MVAACLVRPGEPGHQGRFGARPRNRRSSRLLYSFQSPERPLSLALHALRPGLCEAAPGRSEAYTELTAGGSNASGPAAQSRPVEGRHKALSRHPAVAMRAGANDPKRTLVAAITRKPSACDAASLYPSKNSRPHSHFTCTAGPYSYWCC